jgi:hypothetical protein
MTKRIDTPSARRRLTWKQRVLRVYPQAVCWKRESGGYLVSNGMFTIGATFNSNASAAWRDAWRRT